MIYLCQVFDDNFRHKIYITVYQDFDNPFTGGHDKILQIRKKTNSLTSFRALSIFYWYCSILFSFASFILLRFMSKQKPGIPKGTRDFGPKQMAKRNFLLDTIRDVFKKFGFLPLETPTMENLSVLTGKYGDEGDQLLFKVLNSGDFLSKVKEPLESFDSKSLTPKISEKGLRYDLTVPFARFVVMNQNELTFPFRRYQIQPVWRADRPQKGRYREFMQCDADVVGTNSLLCEAEIIMMLNEALSNLNIEGYQISVNSRKILTGIAVYLGHPGEEAALSVAIDKLDKIGLEGVFTELRKLDYTDSQLNNLRPILELEGDFEAKAASLRKLLEGTVAIDGLNELEEITRMVRSMNGKLDTLFFDPSLARGLSYYTGAIFEVKMLDKSIGSISGGGRYDDLTGVFGLPDVSGVGISLGIDRIYDVMEARELFPSELEEASQVLIINFGEETVSYALKVLGQLRARGIRSEMYPEPAKLKKQMNYANRTNIPNVLLLGSEEQADSTITWKTMKTGEQRTLDLITFLEEISS